MGNADFKNSTSINPIAEFASLKYQEKHLANFAKDECVLLGEVVMDYLGHYYGVESVLQNTIKHYTLSDEEVSAIRGFTNTVRTRLDTRNFYQIAEKEKYTEIFHKNPDWLAVREAAQNCLKKLGVDLQAWEDKNVK